MPPPEQERTYTREEVETLLGRAVERDRAPDAMTRAEVDAAAREAGISAAAVDAAARELEAERSAGDDRAPSDPVLARQRAVRKLGREALTFLVVNAFLFGVAKMTNGMSWFYWVLLGWGLGLAMRAVRVVFPREPKQRARERLPRGERMSVASGAQRVRVEGPRNRVAELGASNEGTALALGEEPAAESAPVEVRGARAHRP